MIKKFQLLSQTNKNKMNAFSLKLSLLLFLSINMASAESINYKLDDIEQLKKNQSINQDVSEFVREYFTNEYPKIYLQELINDQSSSPLVVEYKLYRLLSEVAFHVKQPFLESFISEMKSYSVRSYVKHEEGNRDIPAFDLPNKARGIENIWKSSASLSYYQNRFDSDPMAAVIGLKNKESKLSTPQWLGLKNSIHTMTRQTQSQVAEYLLNDAESMKSLGRFVSRFALFSSNEELVRQCLLRCDNKPSQFVLRKLSTYFNDDFVIVQLIQQMKSGSNQNFAASLLVPYLGDSAVVVELIDSLKNENVSRQAAFVLSHVQDDAVFNQLKSRYFRSQLADEKKQIVFALKMNANSQAQLTVMDLYSQMDEGSVEKVWLNSFNGVMK